ncbi:MAG: hypothetical protein QOD66_639 [Solirubrobacteraceae bacterium]|nr:hypothetical protein [Solirubrobacteraceae bacterium]
MTAMLAIGAVSALLPASAAAGIFELGVPKSPLVAPVCPPTVTASNCTIILTQVTALATIRDGVAYPTTVTKAGKIVAFSLGLSRLDKNLTTAKNDVHFLDTTYGGTARAGITILKLVGKKSLRRWKVMAQSPIYHLQPYLGTVVQFPLDTSIPVTPGEVVALTVPTWAPVLSFNLPTTKFAYRQSRASNCNHPAATTQTQTTIGASTRYVCDYPGTRVEYSATEVSNPVPPKIQIHAADVPR